MTESEKQELVDAGIAADRLRTDPAFQRAIVQMRKDAIEALIACPHTDAEGILTQQANIRAIDNLCGEIASAIQRGTPRKSAAVA